MKKLINLVSCSAIALSSNVALAQTEDSQINDPNIIVVTAQKREQNLQDVPISITAIGADTLESKGISGFEQLQFIAPGIAFAPGISPRQSATVIRGVGTSLFNTGIEGSTAVAIDGIILGREGAGIIDFSDIERVEVLRGPQGTLFGKNASAGVVSFVTKNPTKDFTASASASYGSLDEIKLSGAVSGPIGDSVGFRLSGFRNKRDGFYENVNPAAPDRLINNKNDFGFRGKLAFDIGPDSDVVIGADYSKRDEISGGLTALKFSDGSPGSGFFGSGLPILPNLQRGLGIVAGPSNRQLGSEGQFISEGEVYGGYIEANIAVGDHTLTSLTGYREWHSFDNQDADLNPLPMLALNSGEIDQSQWSQELRLTSPADQALTYVLGAFAYRQKIRDRQQLVGTFGLDLLGAIPAGTTFGGVYEANIKETNLALFGQAEFALSDQFKVIAGARVLRSKISSDSLVGQAPQSIAPAGAGIIIAPRPGTTVTPTPLTAETRDTAFVWRLGAQYDFSDDVNVFATVSRGYKSAGVATAFEVVELQDATGAGTGTFSTVRPEIPTQYEVGIRSKALDRRLIANLTGFYTEVKDFQAQTLVQRNGINVFDVGNAEKVRTYGFELDLTMIPSDNLTFTAGVAYTNARFKSFIGPCYTLQARGPNDCIAGVGGAPDRQDLAGARLSLSPDWVINVGGRYDFDDMGGFKPFIQAGYQLRSDAASANDNDPAKTLDGYGLLDAQIGARFLDGRATLTFFGRNLTDQDFSITIAGAPFDDGGLAQIKSFEAQRTFGVRLSLDY